MTIKTRTLVAVVAGATLEVCLTAAARAQHWEGRWAANEHACRMGDDAGEHTPFRLSRRAFVFYEGVCSVRFILRLSSAWKVRTSCRIEGESDRRTYRLELASATRLTMTEGRYTSHLVRCGVKAAR